VALRAAQHRRLTIGLALAGVLVLVLVWPASAFVRSKPRGRALPVRWSQPRIELVLRTRELPAGWTRAGVLAALTRARRRWSAPAVRCTALQIGVRDGDERAPGALRDKVSSLSVYARAFCRGGVERSSGCYDPRMAALTTTQLGELVGDEIAIDEADIEVNAAGFRYAPLGRAAARGELDFEAVLVHELGHALGLADNCRVGGASARSDHRGRSLPDCRVPAPHVLRSVMFPAAQTDPARAHSRQRRTLTSDDIAGACALYPAAEPAR
jgi:hypothetical protein